jgi:hypothetical protein
MISIILNVVLVFIILGMLARFRASGIYFSWVNLSGTFRRIWDNVRRGWNSSDYWGLDSTVCKFILPRLKEYRENLHGCPGGLTLSENCTTEQVIEEDFDAGMNEWKKILDKMIFSFECVLNDNEDIEMPDMKFKTVKTDNGYFLEHDCTPEQEEQHKKDMDVYMKKLEVRQKEIQEGLQLFAKYFQGLWD